MATFDCVNSAALVECKQLDGSTLVHTEATLMQFEND